MKLELFNSKQTRKIIGLIEKQYGCKLKLDYAFLRSSDDKIFIVNKKIREIDLSNLKINSIGYNFGQIHRGEIRLSVEGSQLVGPRAKKNVCEVSREQMLKWLRGEDIDVGGNHSGFVIIKHEKDFFASGKFKQGKVLNYLSKSRWVAGY